LVKDINDRQLERRL